MDLEQSPLPSRARPPRAQPNAPQPTHEEDDESVVSGAPDVAVRQQVIVWAAKADCKCRCTGRNGPCFDPTKDDHVQMAVGFRRLSQEQRTMVLRAALYVVTALPGASHDMQPCPRPPKRRKGGASAGAAGEAAGSSRGYATSIYMIRGLSLCVGGFCAILQISRSTLQHHHADVARMTDYKPYTSAMHNNARGARANTLLVQEFLRVKADRDALFCPTGRGSQRDQPVQLLTSDTLKKAVYQEYKDAFPLLYQAYMRKMEKEGSTGRPPKAQPLNEVAFGEIWTKSFPFLKIAKPKNDLCDTCAQLKQQIKVAGKTGPPCDEISASLFSHLERAAAERTLYDECRITAARGEADHVHLTFDFAEEVLLPRLKNQPSQLYFRTGIKADIFGVYVANVERQLNYTLIEGHWPVGKDASRVCSMLHDALADPLIASLPQARHLVLHTENCAGQNKNRFVMAYLAWRVMVGLNDTIKLYFMVAGHTKNMCDAYFGLIKRRIKQRDVWTPRDMMAAVEDSTASSTCKPGSAVRWINWEMLMAKYMDRAIENISGVFHFEFSAARPGVVRLKATSSSDPVDINLRCNDDDPALNLGADLNMDGLLLEAKALSKVPSILNDTREDYLAAHIANKYKGSEGEFLTEFLSDGTTQPI